MNTSEKYAYTQLLMRNEELKSVNAALEDELAEYEARELRLEAWIDKLDDETGGNHENDEIGQAVDDALTKVVKQFCTVWSEGTDTSCPVCGSVWSCKHREQEKP